MLGEHSYFEAFIEGDDVLGRILKLKMWFIILEIQETGLKKKGGSTNITEPLENQPLNEYRALSM